MSMPYQAPKNRDHETDEEYWKRHEEALKDWGDRTDREAVEELTGGAGAFFAVIALIAAVLLIAAIVQ